MALVEESELIEVVAVAKPREVKAEGEDNEKIKETQDDAVV